MVVLELGVTETREIRDRSPSPARRVQPDFQRGTDAPRLGYRPSRGFTLWKYIGRKRTAWLTALRTDIGSLGHFFAVALWTDEMAAGGEDRLWRVDEGVAEVAPGLERHST